MSAEIVGFDPATGMLSLPWWAASIIAAVVVACIAAAVARGGILRTAATLVTLALVGACVAAAWTWLARPTNRDNANERHALEARFIELSRPATAPGSPLGCLDGLAGEAVESACEKALFASADTVASATSYVAAKIVLLTQAMDATGGRSDPEPGVASTMRRTLEADRFGFAAQVLASLYGCTADKCDAFQLFGDTARLRANLKEAAFDGFVSRNAAAWPARPVRPAMAGPAGNPAGASPVPPGFNVPSAASIPPVSIMNPEPAPPAATPPAAAEASPPPAAPARRPARPAPRPANAPVPIVPPGATAGSTAQ